jgi:hypothetical protein
VGTKRKDKTAKAEEEGMDEDGGVVLKSEDESGASPSKKLKIEEGTEADDDQNGI